MSEQLTLTGFEFSEAEMLETFRRSASGIAYRMTFPKAMQDDTLRRCLRVETEIRNRRRNATARRGKTCRAEIHR